jgi:hypothetical protein
VHELVLVLSDFYVSQEALDRELPVGVTLPAFQHVARYGTRSKLSNGWRPWLSQWFFGADAGATAGVAAASMQPVELSATASLAPGNVAWMATPMHLIAGMTSVHVDRRSILRLDASDQATLAADFQRVFHDSGFRLQPLEGGDFLMLGTEMALTDAEEPARALGGSMGQHANSSIALRRLGTEIEMWLHDHPINDTRRRRGEVPITSLWLWGVGAIPARGDVDVASRGSAAVYLPAAGARAAASHVADSPGDRRGAGDLPGAADGTLAFGRDSYLQGLWAMRGAKVAPLPQQVADVFGYPHAQRAVLVIEIGVMLQSNPKWTFYEAVADIERRFIAPAVEALKGGQYQRLVVLANDYELTLRATDRLKFWRRAPPGLSGLQ